MQDLIERQAMRDELDKMIVEYWREAHILTMVKQALFNLPSTKSEITDCEYCNEDSDGYIRPLEKNCHAYIRFGMDGWGLNLNARGWHGRVEINYCPMCGRELKHG